MLPFVSEYDIAGVIELKIVISETAFRWFQEEMGLKTGDKVKFYTQIYGSSPVQKGFALGFARDNSPINPAVYVEKDGIGFYVEESDAWFFDGHDLHVDYNRNRDELEYQYIKE